MKIHLLTIVGGHIELLPFMLAHYRQLGLQSVVIHLHLRHADDRCLTVVRDIATQHICSIAKTTIGEWQTLSQAQMWTETMREYPDDWCILADQDELQTYQDDLPSILRYCDRKGYDSVSGALLDRVAIDGAFPPADSMRSIWTQYPLACLLSFAVLGARTHKVVAAKGRVVISNGHHRAMSGLPCPVQDVFVPVHHFKWTADIVRRLEERSAAYRAAGTVHWTESDRFVQYVKANGGRINLFDPRLMLARCGQTYPHWPAFTRMAAARLAASGAHVAS